MILKYAVSKEDFAQYYAYVFWDAPEQRKKKIKYVLRQLFVSILFVAIILYSGVFNFYTYYLYIYLGIFLLLTAFQIFSSRNNIIRQATKITNDENNASIFLEKTIEIDENGLFIKDELTETRLKWQAFIRKKENKDYYYLFISTIEAIIIPKRIFKTDDEINRFEKLLRQQLSLDAEVGHLIQN